MFVGIYRGITLLGFLRSCRILSIHSRSANKAEIFGIAPTPCLRAHVLVAMVILDLDTEVADVLLKPIQVGSTNNGLNVHFSTTFYGRFR